MATAEKKLKLNYPNTIKVGLAFCGISLFWGAYDFVIPLLLENAYGLSNALRGLVMGLDNLLSLFMLPLFGRISDRLQGKLLRKFGKRTPFIVFGTLAAVICMVFVPISSQSQLKKSDAFRRDYMQSISCDTEEGRTNLQERLIAFYNDDGNAYCDHVYLADNNVTREEFIAIEYYDIESSGIFSKTYTLRGEEIDKETYDELNAKNADYNKYVAAGMKVYLSEEISSDVFSSNEGVRSLVGYMCVLLICLVAMSTYRSPAVALMPDVTPKPLRSQANAIINLMGGIGAAIAFVIYTVTLWVDNINNYIIIFGSVAGSMLLILAFFLLLVKENKLAKECHDLSEEFGLLDEEDEEKQTEEKGAKRVKTPEEKAKFRSFLLILASIFMWFMGYNAVSSSMSVYCTKALNLPAGVASIVSGVSMGVSAVAFIPVGFMAAKIGRRKSIIIGFALAAVSYVLLLLFVRQNDNYLLPAVLFSAFYLIAGFGLIIANVNTFPMVVELSNEKDVGKYTGFYYTATMSAQAITPMLSGLIMDKFGNKYLFLYSAIAVAIAIVLMFFVKHGDSKPIGKGKKLTSEEKKNIMLESMQDAD